MKLTVSLVQMRTVIAKPEENLRRAEGLVAEAARRGSDLVCFPEMWTTGFDWTFLKTSTDAHQAAIEKVAALARRYRVWINGSMPMLTEAGTVANTSLLYNADGELAGSYRKVHLFSLLRENDHLAAGESLSVVDTTWGPFGLAVCYDIRFPELFRSYALQGARVVLSPAAFPHPRLDHWQVLARARAIENQMFFIGLNRVGSENFGPEGSVTYCGHSVVIDPWGKIIVEAGEAEEALLTATINLKLADEVRARMRVLGDRRPELYRLGP